MGTIQEIPAKTPPEMLDGILSPIDFINAHSLVGCNVHTKSRVKTNVELTEPIGPVKTIPVTFIVLRCSAHNVESHKGVDHLSSGV